MNWPQLFSESAALGVDAALWAFVARTVGYALGLVGGR